METKQQIKKPLKILFSVDDIHPEIGYGLFKNNDNFNYLNKLNKEFGLNIVEITYKRDVIIVGIYSIEDYQEQGRGINKSNKSEAH